MAEEKIIKIIATDKKTGKQYERVIDHDKMLEGQRLRKEKKLKEKEVSKAEQ